MANKMTVTVPTTTISAFQIPNCNSIKSAIIKFENDRNSLIEYIRNMYSVAAMDGADGGTNFKVDGKVYIGPKLETLTDDFWKEFKSIDDVDFNNLYDIAVSKRNEICNQKIAQIENAFDELKKANTKLTTDELGSEVFATEYSSSEQSLQLNRKRDIEIIQSAKDGGYDG